MSWWEYKGLKDKKDREAKAIEEERLKQADKPQDPAAKPASPEDPPKDA